MKIQWSETLESNKVALGPTLFSKLSNPSTITLHFGAMTAECNVAVSDETPDDTIALPLNISDTYTVPANLPYEGFIKDGQVYIGPVIAFVVTGHFKQLTAEKLSLFLPRFNNYKTIKGLLFVCTSDSIDINNSIIDGYYFDPGGRKTGSFWQHGRFPLPNAVFNRSFLNQKKIKILQERIGKTIFNSYWHNLNKWLIYTNLSKSEIVKNHLPFTEKFVSIEQLNTLLSDYGSLYIKPFCQSRGRGILNVTKTNRGIQVTDDQRRTFHLIGDINAYRYLKDNFGRAIIQQAVPYKIGNQQLDFRIFLQRDSSKEWKFSGYISRISQTGSIITNVRGREKVALGREALTSYFKMSEQDAADTEKEMVNLVKAAIKIYEEKGMHLADLAADVVLDANRHLWLLELQLNYAAEKGYPILPELFKNILVTPFEYAKTLSGFI